MLVPGAKYFAEAAILAAEREAQNPASRTTLVVLDPRLFLRLAKPAPAGGAARKIEPVREAFAAGTKFADLPYLKFVNNGDGSGLVVGHEGRHRCMVLADHGVTSVPVRLTCLEGGYGETIRWGKSPVSKRPKFLRGQEKNSNSVVPLPDSLAFPYTTSGRLQSM